MIVGIANPAPKLENDMEKAFEYGGYNVVVKAVPAPGGFQADVRIGDAFGSPGEATFEQEMAVTTSEEEAVAQGEALAMAAIDSGEVS